MMMMVAQIYIQQSNPLPSAHATITYQTHTLEMWNIVLSDIYPQAP